MAPFQRSIIGSGLVIVMVVGCGPKVMPKGTGATGKLNAAEVVADPDLGLALVNKLSKPHEMVFEWMHTPFESAIVGEPAKSEIVDRAREEWPRIEFAQVKPDRRIHYLVDVVTSAGTIEIDLGEGFSPNLVRNFITLARAGYFNGLPLKLEESMIHVGDGPENAPYFINPNAASSEAPLLQGAIVANLTPESKAGATSFGIVLIPKKDHEGKVAPFGLVKAADAQSLDKIKEALQAKNAVTIERVVVEEQTFSLFGTASVNLPENVEPVMMKMMEMRQATEKKGAPPAGGPPGVSKPGNP